jgi:flagellar hook assembly protein FlgD
LGRQLYYFLFIYQITKPGSVSLKVYNIAGQIVKTVVSSRLPAGRYSASWDGRDEQDRTVAAGVYLYQLQAGDRTLTKKMVLVR